MLEVILAFILGVGCGIVGTVSIAFYLNRAWEFGYKIGEEEGQKHGSAA